MALDPDHPVKGGRGGAVRQDKSRISSSWIDTEGEEGRSNDQLSCLLSGSAPAEPLRGAAALGIAPREPRHRLRRHVWSSHAHPHTPGLSQHCCNVVIICNHCRWGTNFYPSIHQVAADGGSLHLFEKIPLLWSCTWAFHSREKTRRTSSQVHGRPHDGSPLSSRTLLVWRLTWLPSLSLPPFPSIIPSLPPLPFPTLIRRRTFLKTCVFLAVEIQKSERNRRQKATGGCRSAAADE